jgi:hypothetical protein
MVALTVRPHPRLFRSPLGVHLIEQKALLLPPISQGLRTCVPGTRDNDEMHSCCYFTIYNKNLLIKLIVSKDQL